MVGPDRGKGGKFLIVLEGTKIPVANRSGHEPASVVLPRDVTMLIS
jgi:hypothetical protein